MSLVRILVEEYLIPSFAHCSVLSGLIRGKANVGMTTALEGDEWSAARPGRTLPPGGDPVPILQEAGWASGPVWTGAGNLATTGIRSYRDSIPGPSSP
jgi:hypothetical protein